MKNEGSDLTITDNIRFSGKMVLLIVVATAGFVGIYAKSESADSALKRELFLLQKEAGIQQAKNSIHWDDIHITLNGILEQQKIQTILQGARMTDRWTCEMEEESQDAWVEILSEIFPNVGYIKRPDLRAIQTKHLSLIGTQ